MSTTIHYTLMYRDKHYMEVIELCSDVIETFIRLKMIVGMCAGRHLNDIIYLLTD